MYNKLILVLNCGSSSLKFAIIDSNSNIVYINGIAECLYTKESKLLLQDQKSKIKKINLNENASHSEALRVFINFIINKKKKMYHNIYAIGHRVVHGGEKLKKSVIIDENVIKDIEDAIHFAPTHNPAHLIGIRESFKIFPKLLNKNVAVFDTSFYKDLKEKSYLYAIPYYLYKKYGIRRYGAHGISHFYVTRKASKILNIKVEKINLISCHLGNGSSISAIKQGKCIDTSMGMTPLEGLIMGTRSGDIDPSIIFYLNEVLNISLSNIKKMITEQSGLLGLTEYTNDCRYIENNYDNKLECKRAIDIYCYRLIKYIGAYSILMNGKLDAIIFTGGIGENSSKIREISIKKLSTLGFKLDQDKNLRIKNKAWGIITTKNSKPVIVIPTKEELIIAQDTAKLIDNHKEF